MATTILFTCDRCGAISEQQEDMFRIKVFCCHIGDSEKSQIAVTDWCGKCCEDNKIIPLPPPRKKISISIPWDNVLNNLNWRKN